MRKNKLILLQLVIACVLICTSVYATVNTTISVKASETNLKRGDEVSVTLSLKDVEESSKVESVSGYINYDTKVIEPITVDSIQKDENNTVTIGNETLTVEDLTNATVADLPTSSAYVAFNGAPTSGNNSRIVIDFADGITKDTDLLTIKFKVKSDATTGTIEKAISYSMFVVTAGSENSSEITENVSLTIATSDTDSESNTTANNAVVNNTTVNNTVVNNTTSNKNTTNNTSTNSTTNKNATNTNTNVSNTNNNTNDQTVSGTKLPATGAKLIILPAIVLIVLAYISYNKYMRYKDI